MNPDPMLAGLTYGSRQPGKSIRLGLPEGPVVGTADDDELEDGVEV
jgi:hypothetical protein